MTRGRTKKRSRDFEPARAVAWTIGMVNRDPKKSFPNLYDFWPLPTDKKEDLKEKGDLLQQKLNRYKEAMKKKKSNV